MTRILKIDSIEGNSNLGNPMFSNYGKMQNYQYLVLSPVKEGPDPVQEAKQQLTKDNMNFKIKNTLEQVPGVKIGGKGLETVPLSTKERHDKIDKILSAYDAQNSRKKKG